MPKPQPSPPQPPQPSTIPSWHLQYPVHDHTTATIVSFLKATTPTPLHGHKSFRFRFYGSAQQAKKLPQNLRVALSRIRNKARDRNMQTIPFVMHIGDPDKHTIGDETFYIFELARQRQQASHNPFDSILDAETIIAISDRRHAPTAFIQQLLIELNNKGEVALDAHKWPELCAAVWLYEYGYATYAYHMDEKLIMKAKVKHKHVS